MINLLNKYIKWTEYNKLRNIKDLIACISDDIRRSAINKIDCDANLLNTFRCTYIYKCEFLKHVKENERQKLYTKIKNKILKSEIEAVIPINKNNNNMPATYNVTVNDFDIEPISNADSIIYLRVDIGIKIRVKRLYYYIDE